MDRPLFSIRVEPAAGSSLTYTGEAILLNVAVENTSPIEIALPFEKVKHAGVFLKFADGKDPTQFAYSPRCPGGDAPEEREEPLTTLAPGSSVRFVREVTHWDLEQFRGPEEVDVVCEFTIRSKVLVGQEWKEQRSQGSARIQGRREVKK
jgi:hypothetical protein